MSVEEISNTILSKIKNRENDSPQSV